ncbi:MAG: transcription termination factor Rho [Puniceicoccales bacterium]|jgi:transcription termination factor Rho|nr:transcription termination factor Rho [Puniceicoccales bacterium]
MSADETSTDTAARVIGDETTPAVPVKKHASRKAAATDSGDDEKGEPSPPKTPAGKKRATRKDDALPAPVSEPEVQPATPPAPESPPPSATPPAPEPPPSPEPSTPAPAPLPPEIPAFKVVGEDDSASAPAPVQEVFVFDPAKILAQFSPPVAPASASAPAPAVASTTPAPVSAGESSPAALPENAGDGATFPRLRTDLGEQHYGNEKKARPAAPPPSSPSAGAPKPSFNNNNSGRVDRRHVPPPPQSQSGGGGQHSSQGGGAGKKPFPPAPPHGGGKKDNKFRKGNAPNGKPQPGRQWGNVTLVETVDERSLSLGESFDYSTLNDPVALEALAATATGEGDPFDFNATYDLPVNDLVALGKAAGCKWHRTPPRRAMISELLAAAHDAHRPIHVKGTLELLDNGNGLLVYLFDNYRIRELSAFVPKALISRHGLLRGHEVDALALPAREGETAPIVVRVDKIMGESPETIADWVPFTELTPYYPTRRIFLETDSATATWDNLSMRCVDLLCPIGLGQRGLIVSPPRTGKTILLQGMASAILKNTPQAHLIVLLVDERPEEVTDFRRQVGAAEIVSSTFDETAESHVHAAEIVIERARRMVEAGKHVVILLDSITRLARAYNTMMPGTGKILSGGVESNALSKPKRFFGSARNIEGGGSLTILGTALVETGSKMDEVIFEEFKGTGNMELDLDRDLANKRIFPAINFERSGTRKEELLYHPDELLKIYSLRRAMKGVPSVEAMEQLIQRIKKTKTNVEFLVSLSR